MSDIRDWKLEIKCNTIFQEVDYANHQLVDLSLLRVKSNAHAFLESIGQPTANVDSATSIAEIRAILDTLPR